MNMGKKLLMYGSFEHALSPILLVKLIFLEHPCIEGINFFRLICVNLRSKTRVAHLELALTLTLPHRFAGLIEVKSSPSLAH